VIWPNKMFVTGVTSKQKLWKGQVDPCEAFWSKRSCGRGVAALVDLQIAWIWPKCSNCTWTQTVSLAVGPWRAFQWSNVVSLYCVNLSWCSERVEKGVGLWYLWFVPQIRGKNRSCFPEAIFFGIYARKVGTPGKLFLGYFGVAWCRPFWRNKPENWVRDLGSLCDLGRLEKPSQVSKIAHKQSSEPKQHLNALHIHCLDRSCAFLGHESPL
jgi:hypothetical protein